MVSILKSLAFFILAGICEIGGGYFIWQYMKNDKGLGMFLLGAVTLIVYGIIPTFQEASFGRVYAAYGGIFIVLSLLWGYWVDQVTPDRFDIIGGAIALIGVMIIMFYPR
ncbi:hypothetical protein AB840_12650 [Megasphaera cerevisiae DSM 20462]|jgi:small multidrug resistance family-3 protein|uniref:Uncharacterized protein n=1 Tax=Megasphaera cerevisiae DSM 20462 TaxID=1122219 RepID=A0A0J6WSZ6_9FIRM|nr:YnfA family protein [Megasphaera cerevisiae]KMO85614.1 hypothetical protein AB840_12650 [Megasphaera cerevisiae DSM 20462]OKY52639.1 hypothetical protein BSR42_11730 [Megasphaera cerevisiae]SKA12811.1 small multidrug resistance family-3 protein [Megasphaera cerevisiae DSM 20462]